MLARRSIMALVCLSATATFARAEVPPDARTTGPQDQRATAPVTTRPPLTARTDQRTAVRGCPVDMSCLPWRDELREFELEAFSTAAGPWIESTTGPRRAASPTELRPDLPWLADLTMPDLPMTWDRRVIDYLIFYKDDPRGRRIMRGWLERQGRYREVILTALRKAHLPEDLLYVAMIESSYDSSERSRVGASGLWQFMPGGGRIYGLTIDRWVDERNDPVRATEAAVGFWLDLYQRFGNWDLAMAAYNAGYGAVLKGIARFNTNDFWALVDYENALPWESGIYVPKALAAAIVGHNRATFGFADVDLGAPERWDDVTVPQSIALGTIAKAAGCSVADLQRLNPHLRKNRTPAGRAFVMRVPAGGGVAFATKLGQLRGDWDDVDTYVARYGERFEDIATQFGISRTRLRALNDLDHDSEVTGGTVLVVPRVAADVRAKNLAAAADDLYGSGVDHRPGEALIVAVPDKDVEVAGARRVFYRVVAGDGLRAVASALSVPAADLARWNGVTVDAALQPRMVLQAFVAPAWSADAANVALLDERRLIVVSRGSKEHLELSEGRSGRERVEYVATKRETYEQIGKRFGLGKRDLARINRKSPDTVVDKGEMVVVYKVVDRTRSNRAEKQWKQLPKGQRKGGKATGGKATGGKGPKKVSAAADDGDDGDDDTADAVATAPSKGDAPAVAQARPGDGPTTRKRGADAGKTDAAAKSATAEPAAKPTAKAEPEPAAKPTAKAEPAPTPAAKPEPAAKPTAKAEPAPTPAAKPEPAPAPNVAAKPEPAPAPKAEDVGPATMPE
ncbi:MAG: transglycosylase SLT domain-containing protein [Myxococcales bacterium]|nr:transglycosylase SLT domain-containing protein [Myxococcales bacterium]